MEGHEPSPNLPTSESVARRVFVAREYAALEVPLELLLDRGSLRIYPEVLGRDLFRIGASKDVLTIYAGGSLGLIPLNEHVTIEVRSRVPISNLGRLLAISQHLPLSLSPLLRHYATADEELPSLLDAIANAFLGAVQSIQDNGVLREAARRVSTTANPKGRILLQDSMRRNWSRGQKHMVEVAWFDETTDNEVNRCIKYALSALCFKYSSMVARKGASAIRSRLNRAVRLFDLVSMDNRRGFLQAPSVQNPSLLPSLRQYYSDAISLAKLVALGQGLDFESHGSDLSLASLLITMDEVFEGYIRNVLASAFEASNSVSIRNGNHAPPAGGAKRLFGPSNGMAPIESLATPDIVIDIAAGEARRTCVVDVKYKPLKRNAEREDINQIVAYGASYGCERVLLVYPAGDSGSSGLKCLGQVGLIAVYQYQHDLGAPDLRAEERKLFEVVSSLLG